MDTEGKFASNVTYEGKSSEINVISIRKYVNVENVENSNARHHKHRWLKASSENVKRRDLKMHVMYSQGVIFR